MGMFQDQLEQRAGGSLGALNASNEQIGSWNRGVERGHARAFDDRVLLGLGIDERSPPHGDVRAYQVRVGKQLGRSDRWVRETVQVAVAIRTALEMEVDLPVELRKIPWRVVPTAIDNVKAGRALDHRPKKPKKPLTVRGVRKLVKQLVDGLEGLDPAVRGREQGLALEALQGVDLEAEPPPTRPEEPPATRPPMERPQETVDRATDREGPPRRRGRGRWGSGRQ